MKSKSRIATLIGLVVFAGTIFPSGGVSAELATPLRVEPAVSTAYEDEVARFAASEAERIAFASEFAIRRSLEEWTGAAYAAASLASWAQDILKGSELYPPRSHPLEMVRLVLSKVKQTLRLTGEATTETGVTRLSLVESEFGNALAAHRSRQSPTTSQALIRVERAYQRVVAVVALSSAITAWAPAVILVAKTSCHSLVVLHPYPSWWDASKDVGKLIRKLLNPGPIGDLGSGHTRRQSLGIRHAVCDRRPTTGRCHPITSSRPSVTSTTLTCSSTSRPNRRCRLHGGWTQSRSTYSESLRNAPDQSGGEDKRAFTAISKGETI